MNARQGFIDFLLFYFTNFFNKELQTAWKDNMILNFKSTYEYSWWCFLVANRTSSFQGGWSLSHSPTHVTLQPLHAHLQLEVSRPCLTWHLTPPGLRLCTLHCIALLWVCWLLLSACWKMKINNITPDIYLQTVKTNDYQCIDVIGKDLFFFYFIVV